MGYFYISAQLFETKVPLWITNNRYREINRAY